ncbi:hypothetical protein GRI91_10595 [Altererythrobacter endophyticus]|uniref:Uncharacterized protein n=2 Tax=Altericroceibacterium endophyticum TaxID=1808508 RepID=A0A6I4T8W5_9SPHN|nr:hypothetical protein [Altericroceibacterium endophyticum]
MMPNLQRRAPFAVDALVLHVARTANRALSAKAISQRLAASGEPVAPMQIYRSLHRLQCEGKVRRIECLNAFCCDHGGELVVFCSDCHAFVCLEDEELRASLADMSGHLGYQLNRSIIEIAGTCPDCAGRTR